MDPKRRIAIRKKIEKKRRKNKPCRCCNGRMEGCNSGTRKKCPVPLCDEVVPLCILDCHEGYCMACSVAICSHGKRIVDRINHPNFCQLCFERMTAMGDGCEDDALRYHKRCWTEHMKND